MTRMASDIRVIRPPTMPQAAAATPPDTAALDRHLRSVERRAFGIAALSLADADAAFDVVQDAVWTVVHGEAPTPFWQAFDRHLLARQQRAQRPRWTAWLDRNGGPAVDDDPDHAADARRSTAFLQLPTAAAQARFEAALRALAPRPRQAFLLRVWAELDQAHVTQAMAMADADLAPLLVEALRTLRADLAPTTASRDDGRWILHGRAALDAGLQALDGESVARLERIRRDALAPPADVAPVAVGQTGVEPASIEPAQVAPAPSEPVHAARAPVTGRPGAAPLRPRHAVAAPPAPRAPTPAADTPSFLAPRRHRPRATRRAASRPLAWFGAAALAAGVVLLALRLWPAPPPSRAQTHAPPPVQLAPTEDTPLAAPDFDLLVDGEDAALLQDLAFYAWLEDSGAHED